MTLFTAEGLMRAQVRSATKGICHPPGVVHHAYQRWLPTQVHPGPPDAGRHDPDFVDGWLGQQQWLYSRRAPGNTCLSALEATRGSGYGRPAQNTSKGCGAVMRSAPFGLARLGNAPGVAVECAALTYGHPTGQLASGALAVIIASLAAGYALGASVDAALDWLGGQHGSGETIAALAGAVEAARQGPVPGVVPTLGEGWIAEEALAIGTYCSLAYPEPGEVRQALSLSVSHGGDSDSTGSICGNILGTLHGASALPADLVEQVEGREAIEAIAADLWVFAEEPGRLQAPTEAGRGSMDGPRCRPELVESLSGLVGHGRDTGRRRVVLPLTSLTEGVGCLVHWRCLGTARNPPTRKA